MSLSANTTHGDTLSPSWVSPLHARISVNKAVVVEEPVGELRALWEETSFQLDLLQAEPRCVIEEKQGLKERTGPSYYLPPTFPVASVPCKPGKGACTEAGVLGSALGKASGVLEWIGSILLRDTSSRWTRPSSCHLARRGQQWRPRNG